MDETRQTTPVEVLTYIIVMGLVIVSAAIVFESIANGVTSLDTQTAQQVSLMLTLLMVIADHFLIFVFIGVLVIMATFLKVFGGK